MESKTARKIGIAKISIMILPLSSTFDAKDVAPASLHISLEKVDIYAIARIFKTMLIYKESILAFFAISFMKSIKSFKANMQ